MKRHHRLPLVASFLVIAAACGGADAPEDSAPASGEGAGLTPEELEARAEAMSPEMAESLGIVDSTIGAQSPVAADSLRIIPLPADSPRPPS